MKKQDLESYRKLQIEKQDLQRRLANYKVKPKQMVVDSAKDYSTGYPHTIMLAGYGDPAYTKIRDRWRDKLAALKSKIDEIETWVAKVDDAEMRTILRLYYLDGKTQQEVADNLHIERSTVAKRLITFWEDNNE